jgi:23S rRNA (guanosine2251-2'-O)-methyltransferase
VTKQQLNIAVLGGTGAEGSGLRQLTRDTCDYLVRLPQRGSVESLNVSVATGMLLYEALRQRVAPAATRK